MDFDRFYDVINKKVEPQWSREDVSRLYEHCKCAAVSSDEEVIRIGRGYSLGLRDGHCNGMRTARALVETLVLTTE